MRVLKFLIIVATAAFLSSCADTSNTSTMYVSGYKSEADTEAGKQMVLNVHKGKDLSEPNWELFYEPIEGFEFEEGTLQKIKVKEIHVNDSEVSEENPNVKYELVEVIEKQEDKRVELQDEWYLVKINDQEISNTTQVPTMNIDLSSNTVSGFNGCNNYRFVIESADDKNIDLGYIGRTKLICPQENLEDEFNRSMDEISSYSFSEGLVNFHNNEGKVLFTFKQGTPPVLKEETEMQYPWKVARIDETSVEEDQLIPMVILDLQNMRIAGINGCNNFTAPIKNLNETEIEFGIVASTKKMCPDMKTANQFNKALNEVVRFDAQGSEMYFYNKDGKEMLAFVPNK